MEIKISRGQTVTVRDVGMLKDDRNEFIRMHILTLLQLEVEENVRVNSRIILKCVRELMVNCPIPGSEVTSIALENGNSVTGNTVDIYLTKEEVDSIECYYNYLVVDLIFSKTKMRYNIRYDCVYAIVAKDLGGMKTTYVPLFEECERLISFYQDKKTVVETTPILEEGSTSSSAAEVQPATTEQKKL